MTCAPTRFTLIASAILLAPPALAQTPRQADDHSAHEQHQPPQQPPADPHAGHEGHAVEQRPAQEGGAHGNPDVVGIIHGATTGALGAYPISREGSGTSWLPEASQHGGVHAMNGDWTLMGHATIDGVYSWQDGPRGDEKAFVGGMLMGTAQRRFDDDSVLQFRAMLSPDPLMGKRGYPLLLAAGETADGVNTLVDRQHPHDFFMELSGSYSRQVSDEDSLFVYAGLPGEPAFGPPAFMHRPAAAPSPEAPITHHWFDSTHITFGVVTAGWVHGDIKLEASRFRGREPDENRFDIETGDLDSTAVRLSWNPSEALALQASWADMTSPEQLEPDVDVKKVSASFLYTKPLGNEGELAFTGAFARKDTTENVSLEAWVGEASWRLDDRWTMFVRGEAIESDELGPVHPGPVENAAKFSLGASRDFRIGERVVLAVGGLVSFNSVNDALEPLYDGDPMGGMAFVRLKIG